MIFHKVTLEPVVQVDDMTRIDAGGSFVSSDEGDITTLRISPNNGVDWFDVTLVSSSMDKYFLDWAYDTAGTQTIQVEITTTLTAATIKSYTLEVLSVEDDCLFSDDNDLVRFEPEVLCYLRHGRSSFLDIHRCAQQIILDYLNLQIEIKDCENPCDVPRKLVAKDLFCKQEVKTWSVYQTLVLIYEGLSNQVDDIFDKKSIKYTGLMNAARNRAEITVDYDQDGKADKKERLRSSQLTARG